MVPSSSSAGRSLRSRALPLALAALLLLPGTASAAGATERCAQPRITGTFYQPLARHADWDAGRWAALSEALAELGMQEIFVQWSMADGVAFFPTALRRAIANSPLDRVFEIAAERGARVWVGLELDPDFLPSLDGPPALLAEHLRARERRLAPVLPDLAAYLRRQPAMAGWYISAELYDGIWTGGAAAELVAGHLARLGRMLRAQIDMPVAISTFSNGAQTPERFAAFWADLVRRGGIDLLLFQDGVGAGKLIAPDAGRYAAALQRAIQGQGRAFGVIVEQFQAEAEAESGYGPAPMPRIRQQLAAIAALPDTRRLAFTLPDHIVPERGEPALLLGYRQALAGCP